MPIPILGCTLALIVLSMVTDVRTRRIPNCVTGSAMLVGMVLNTVYHGSAGLTASVTGLVLSAAVLLGPYVLGGIGAGDVKMVGAVGALLGPRLAMAALLGGMALGGVIAFVHVTRRGRARETLAIAVGMVGSAVGRRSLEPLRRRAADPGAMTLPYSVPLGLGTLAVLVGAVGVLP